MCPNEHSLTDKNTALQGCSSNHYFFTILWTSYFFQTVLKPSSVAKKIQPFFRKFLCPSLMCRSFLNRAAKQLLGLLSSITQINWIPFDLLLDNDWESTELPKPARNIKNPSDVQTKCSGKTRNRNYALQVIPPEPGIKPSDSLSNFHGNGITEAWVYSCSRILETKGKTKKNKNMVHKNRWGVEN